MNENSEGSTISFKELLSALANNTANRTKVGKINVSGTLISSKDFDKLYLQDIKDLLAKFEGTISPDFAPTTELYSMLNTFSSPALKNTSVPKTISSFYKKMQQSMKKPRNTKILNETLTEYVAQEKEAPVFMLLDMNSELPQKGDPSIYKQLMPESSTLLNGYGTKFNGSDIIDLANNGFIEDETPMNMLIYKSLYAQDENSKDYLEPISYKALLEFYSPERMRTLLKEGKITPAFSEFHKEMLDNVDPTKRKKYISDLIIESKENANSSEDLAKEILGYNNFNIIPNSSLQNNISSEFLIKQYLAKTITISRIFEIYKTSPKYFSGLESILTANEITSAHSKEEISDDSLMHIPKENRIEYLKKNKTKFSTMMYLYFHCDGFSIVELIQLLTENQVHESLEFYIDVGSSPLKIKELYDNFLIDYQCIKNLKNAGILTDTDIQKYNLGLNKEKTYKNFLDTKTLSITGSGNTVPFLATGFFLENTLKHTTSNTINNSLKILGATDEQQIITITHIDEHEKDSFLNNYRMLPLKDSNLVALLPTSNTSSIYLMPYQEAAFILYNKKLPNNFSENESIKEIKQSEKLDETLLKTAYQFEEAQPHLDRLRIF